MPCSFCCKSLSALLIILISLDAACGIYLMTEYFMDQGQSRAFLGGCGRTVKDACAFVNSHVNTFRISRYSANRDCGLLLDAGENARKTTFRLTFLRWQLEGSDKDNHCNHDYLEFYNGDRRDNNTLIGRYCGNAKPNFTTVKLHRHLSLRFRTDEKNEFSGFKLMAVKISQPPCSIREFYCKREDQCIDGRLECDGTPQCSDGQDELHCTVLQKAFGRILSMGVAGVVGMIIVMVCVILVSTVLLSCCCCRSEVMAAPKSKSSVGSTGSVVLTRSIATTNEEPYGNRADAWRVLPTPPDIPQPPPPTLPKPARPLINGVLLARQACTNA